jgi:hypothetical protein
MMSKPLVINNPLLTPSFLTIDQEREIGRPARR